MEANQEIKKIFQQIAEKDEKLARLFDDFANRIYQESALNRDTDNVNIGKLKSRRLYPEDVLDKSSENGKINVIPSDYDADCQSYCICFAFDKWQSSNGFKGVVNKAFDYWFSCFKVNRGTLIFSYAWDDVDFNEKYKNRCDQYTRDQQHTVAIVLITSKGFSLQYLNR